MSHNAEHCRRMLLGGFQVAWDTVLRAVFIFRLEHAVFGFGLLVLGILVRTHCVQMRLVP